MNAAQRRKARRARQRYLAKRFPFEFTRQQVALWRAVGRFSVRWTGSPPSVVALSSEPLTISAADLAEAEGNSYEFALALRRAQIGRAYSAILATQMDA